MRCSVFRSSRKEYTYLYLPKGASVKDIPEALSRVFGPPEFVIDLELSPERKLAQEDVRQVIQNLCSNGFHLQLPPGDPEGDLEGFFLSYTRAVDCPNPPDETG